MSSTPPAGAHADSDSKASPQRGPEPQATSNKHAAHDTASDSDGSAHRARRRRSPSSAEEDRGSASPVEPGEVEDQEPPPLPVGEEPPPLPVGEEPPPLPVGEEPPPLPSEAPPSDDDGWEALWDAANQAYYFHNKRTGVTQWENPRVPSANTDLPSSDLHAAPSAPSARPHGGYNPAIHGDYDPNADYAVAARAEEAAAQQAVASANARILRIAGIDTGGGDGANPAPGDEYAAAGMFNRFTGRWQAADEGPERHNDENKSRRQMNAYFDVDAAANSHGGRSLKAERQNKKLSKAELKAFKEKRREKKEEKRRAWLRD